MLLRWFPWRYVVSRVARARGLVDPVRILSRLESFAQPLEVKEPLELLRAGMVFHARGLLNAGAIQHNLDWVWPHWVERQYDPEDDAFVPRAFSVTHVNLTHRNWTAVGLPDLDVLPLVDPRGLVTPFWDGWSLDSWILGADGATLVPSRLDRVEQWLRLEDGIAVVTAAELDGLRLVGEVDVVAREEGAALRLRVRGQGAAGGWLAISIRPYNPEGVSFVHHLAPLAAGRGWRLDGQRRVELVEPADRCHASDYRRGDVLAELRAGAAPDGRVRCRVGLATAAALYRLEPGRERAVEVRVPLVEAGANGARPPRAWRDVLAGHARLAAPEKRAEFLWDAAVRTLVLHSPHEVYPGPFTYKRFWFRDAAFILDALLALGFADRAERTLDLFPARQTRSGHFRSQEGEWDSNGEALWILERFCRLTGRPPKAAWRPAVRRAVRWIAAMRRRGRGTGLHAGLLPAGFSAEHLGPNDFYYWDDFWSVAGLRAAASLLDAWGDEGAAAARAEADDLEAAVARSLEVVARRLGRPAMPASPYRRLDSGAVGSLAAGYPLQLWPADDPRLLDTARYLLDECFVGGGFFQDMVHSGVNPYLTLHVAQVLLRAGDPRALELADRVAALASPTGQWPEAIHPRTGGGCMGDGQHAWAAAEWVTMVRNAFVREEADGLVLAAGVPARWLADGASLGPVPTAHGPITVRVAGGPRWARVSWDASWRAGPPPVVARLPGFAPRPAAPGAVTVELEPEPAA